MALDNSVMWSRHYTPQNFKYDFWYPGLFFGIVIFCLISYGVKTRLYIQMIKHGRDLEFAKNLGIDLNDLDSFPSYLEQEILEKKKYDAYI